MRLETLLYEEVHSELEKLKDMKVGSEEYKSTVDGIAKLTDRAIEIEKIKIDKDEKVYNREIENNFKLKSMEDDRKDRYVKNGIAVAGILIPTFVTIWGTLKSFEFEKEGTITTIMGRGFINKLLPKK